MSLNTLKLTKYILFFCLASLQVLANDTSKTLSWFLDNKDNPRVILGFGPTEVLDQKSIRERATRMTLEYKNTLKTSDAGMTQEADILGVINTAKKELIKTLPRRTTLDSGLEAMGLRGVQINFSGTPGTENSELLERFFNRDKELHLENIEILERFYLDVASNSNEMNLSFMDKFLKSKEAIQKGMHLSFPLWALSYWEEHKFERYFLESITKSFSSMSSHPIFSSYVATVYSRAFKERVLYNELRVFHLGSEIPTLEALAFAAMAKEIAKSVSGFSSLDYRQILIGLLSEVKTVNSMEAGEKVTDIYRVTQKEMAEQIRYLFNVDKAFGEMGARTLAEQEVSHRGAMLMFLSSFDNTEESKKKRKEFFNEFKKLNSIKENKADQKQLMKQMQSSGFYIHNKKMLNQWFLVNRVIGFCRSSF